jgi:hypothetical protein
MMGADRLEIWRSKSCLNDERTIRVFVIGQLRFRADTKEQVSKDVLKRQGYFLYHSVHIDND